MTTPDPRSALAELQPPGIDLGDGGAQQRKSAEMRLAILDAAILCLAEHGYAQTNAYPIARIAKISRGAILHHYATKQALIEAVIDYAFYRHMERFLAGIAGLTEQERTQENFGIRLDWQVYQSREYAAYLELMVAARTDDELRSLFIPRARRHDRVWREQLLQLFPEWAGDIDRLEKARRLVQAVMSGMVLNRATWDDATMEQSLLALLSSVLIDVRDETRAWPEG